MMDKLKSIDQFISIHLHRIIYKLSVVEPNVT